MKASTDKKTAILLAHCPDQRGIIATVTDFLHSNKGNILKLDQHVDQEHNHFFMRVEWELEGFLIPTEKIQEFFTTLIAERYQMRWQLHFSDKPKRMAIFVSKMSHCLYDILQRWASKEWEIEKPIIVSNHQNLLHIAERFDIPFYYFPITKENKLEQEQKMLHLLAEQQIDLIILARYMQIVTDTLINTFRNQIINIHHSFLPAFVGARPYHKAHERGVKVIGATSHFVTEELDAGPIIEQDVVKISHRETIKDLIRKGKDVEKLVLSRAIWLMLNHRILVYQNRTVIFD
ncbi:MAG: formyltetrahydrofolate deformylase [Bacteroidota bacterium]